jgi:hypothetical protein
VLEAYNRGDYGVWSRHWSDAMKAAIDREKFESFREQTLPVTGPFVEITSVELKPGDRIRTSPGMGSGPRSSETMRCPS